MYFFYLTTPIFSIFHYIDPNDPQFNTSYTLPSFESWKKSEYAVINKNVVIVQPNTKASKSLKIYVQLNGIQEDVFKNIYHYCPTDSTSILGARCYLDIVENEDVIQYGANSELGSSSIWTLKKPINSEMTFSFYLENRNSTHSARFLLPKLIPFKEKYQKFPQNRIKSEEIGKNIVRHTLFMNNINEEIKISSIPLINPHVLPFGIMRENQGFHTIEGRNRPEISPLTILSNKTHIIGVDIYSYDFWHTWKSNQLSFFSIFLKTRQKFKISLIVIEKKTNSYLEALEIWHQSFPDIYSLKNNISSGMWVPFADLNDCFKNNNDDVDIFMAQNKWGTPINSKKHLPLYKYYEILVEHSKIPYNQTFDLRIKKCANEGNTECKRILTTAARDANGNMLAFAENEGWNQGSYIRVNFAGSRFDEAVKDSKDQKILNTFNGTGSDSFTSTYLDYKTVEHEPDDCLPFYIIDEFDHKYFVPLMANHFKFFKLFKDKMNAGIMTNSFLNIPQLAKFISSAGFEISLVNPTAEYLEYYHDVFWLQRFQLGSHTMSMLENSDRTNSFKYAEEEFSIQLVFGSYPSYFSENADDNNFWDNCKDINLMKPHFKKWNKVFSTTIKNNDYYANCRGIVHQYIPSDNQNPSLNMDDEINDYSMFCEKESQAVNNTINCYVNILLGYRGMDVDQKTFRRIVIYQFDTKPELYFKSDNLNIKIDSQNKVTIILTNVGPSHTYRAASFKVVYDLKKKLVKNEFILPKIHSIQKPNLKFEVPKIIMNKKEFTIFPTISYLISYLRNQKIYSENYITKLMEHIQDEPFKKISKVHFSMSMGNQTTSRIAIKTLNYIKIEKKKEKIILEQHFLSAQVEFESKIFELFSKKITSSNVSKLETKIEIQKTWRPLNSDELSTIYNILTEKIDFMDTRNT